MRKTLLQIFKDRESVNVELEELKDMYRIFSPSFYEQELSWYVQGKLIEAGVEFELMEDQIYSIKEGKPIFCAHLDQVSTMPISEITVNKGKIKGDGNLGADDKNGVWVLLQLLRKYSDDMSFIFSTGEETVTQCDIADLLKKKKDEIVGKIPFGIVFDRRGGGDIVGENNDYCVKEFEDDLHAVLGDLEYSPCIGLFSDADALSQYISCVNLSCGFHMAHTEKEYTVIAELYNALAAGEKIIKEVSGFYDKPVVSNFWYGTKSYQSAYSGYYDDDMYSVWYCPICEDIAIEDYIDDLDNEGDYICIKCYSKLHYHGECYDYELERLFDGDIPLKDMKAHDTDDYVFCPICGWYTYMSDKTICPDCDTTLLKYVAEGYIDYHDQALSGM